MRFVGNTSASRSLELNEICWECECPARPGMRLGLVGIRASGQAWDEICGEYECPLRDEACGEIRVSSWAWDEMRVVGNTSVLRCLGRDETCMEYECPAWRGTT